MPTVAGRCGPPDRTSSSSASRVPAGSGARSPRVSKPNPALATSGQIPSCSSTRKALPCNVNPLPSALTAGVTSARSTRTPACASRIAAAAPAAPPPTTSTVCTAGIVAPLLHGYRVDRGADRTGERDRGGGQPELVHAVPRAVGGQRVEVPHLADEQPDVRDGHLVQRLEGVVELVRPDLETPGVGGDRGDLGAVQPAGGAERQSRRRAARVPVPALPAGPGVPAGADQHDVPPTDRDPVHRGGVHQLVGAD